MISNTALASNVGNISLDEGEKTRIDPAAYGVLMEILSGVYTNASKAVLREYSVNGWDEHRKFGVERPVEVTMPTVLQNVLVIRDYGTRGLEKERVMEVFGSYGTSDKRQDAETAGGFGIGSKAAFALGQQFIVSGFKDGTKFTALFTLNEDGTGTKTVMFEGPTDEPNGVEVSLGVDDVESMRRSGEEFFGFWPKGDVVVDWGEGFVEPESIFDRLEKVNDEIYVDSNGRGEAFAVMGPVAYPADRDLLKKVSSYLEKNGLGEAADLPLRLIDSGTDLYLKVPIGSVRPAPSREALRDKEITIQTLGSVFLGLHQESAVKVQTEVEAAPSLYAAAKVLHEVNQTLGAFKVSRKAVRWNGKAIRKVAPVEMQNYRLVSKTWRGTTMILGAEGKAQMEIEEAEKALVVTGVPEAKIGSVRRYTKRFLEDNEIGINRVFVTDADAVSFEWFQVGVPGGVRTWDLETWKATLRSMRKASPRSVSEPSYTTGFNRAEKDPEDRDLLSDILDEDLPIVIFEGTAAHLNQFERKVLEGHNVVVLLGSQSEKMLRKRIEDDGRCAIVEWATLQPEAAKIAQEVVDSVTDEERDALGARAWLQENHRALQRVRTTISALSRVGKVTAKSLLDAEDAFALAEIYAEPLTDDRFEEVRFALAASGQGGDVTALANDYNDSLVNVEEAYPLVSTSQLRTIDARWRDYVTTDDEGNTKVADNWYYNPNTYEIHKVYLQHALEYVNRH